MMHMTDQQQYEHLCMIVGDCEAQISQLQAAKQLALLQIAQLKAKDIQHENQVRQVSE
jgi:hypothetical protein